jgi:hypothetical protein
MGGLGRTTFPLMQRSDGYALFIYKGKNPLEILTCFIRSCGLRQENVDAFNFKTKMIKDKKCKG